MLERFYAVEQLSVTEREEQRFRDAAMLVQAEMFVVACNEQGRVCGVLLASASPIESNKYASVLRDHHVMVITSLWIDDSMSRLIVNGTLINFYADRHIQNRMVHALVSAPFNDPRVTRKTVAFVYAYVSAVTRMYSGDTYLQLSASGFKHVPGMNSAAYMCIRPNLGAVNKPTGSSSAPSSPLKVVPFNQTKRSLSSIPMTLPPSPVKQPKPPTDEPPCKKARVLESSPPPTALATSVKLVVGDKVAFSQKADSDIEHPIGLMGTILKILPNPVPGQTPVEFAVVDWQSAEANLKKNLFPAGHISTASLTRVEHSNSQSNAA